MGRRLYECHRGTRPVPVARGERVAGVSLDPNGESLLIHVCIPAHNEERTIGVLLWKVRKVMAEFGRDYEILVLDDASSDRTPAVLDRYRSVLPLHVIRSDERVGHGRAVARLLAAASERTEYPKRDVAVTLQGDFSEDPTDLVELVKTVEGGADLVAGVVDADALPFRQRLSRKIARLASGAAVREAPVSDPLSGLRAYRLIVVRKALRELDGPEELVDCDGWAGNVQVLARTAPHARRIEERVCTPRLEPRFRPSRFRLWPALRSLSRLRRRVAWPALVVGMLLVAPGVFPGCLDAQNSSPWTEPAESLVAPVPFGPGERAVYQVKLGPVSVGEGHMEVHGLESVRGRRSYRVSMGLSGGIPLARVDNLYQSWIDVEKLASLRFIQDQHEVRYERFRHFEFFPEERRWERSDVDESGELPTDLPLDDISFVYFARTLPLEVGDTYELDRYFKEDGNPVILKVVRKDRVEVPAGTFNTVVVEPIIQTDGLFGEGGEAEIHFTDDDRRIMVQMNSRVPVVGSLSLHLRDLDEGRPLRDFQLSAAGSSDRDRER